MRSHRVWSGIAFSFSARSASTSTNSCIESSRLAIQVRLLNAYLSHVVVRSRPKRRPNWSARLSFAPSNRIPEKILLRFNRYCASLFFDSLTYPAATPLIVQLIQQVDAMPDQLRRLNKTGVPWHVNLVGEGVTDVGGAARELFPDVCLELTRPSLGVVIPSSNLRAAADCECCFIPNPSPVEPRPGRERMSCYARLLRTICYSSRLREPFRSARFVWNALTGCPVTLSDVSEMDTNFQRAITAMTNCEASGFDAQLFQGVFRNSFEIQTAAGEFVLLVLRGATIRVIFDHRHEFIQCSQKFLSHGVHDTTRGNHTWLRRFFRVKRGRHS